jgi:predicted HTH transcriptional regulator
VAQQKLEYGVLKTIAAFLNTDGGKLVIGATDDSTVNGIEIDYPTLERQSADGWRCAFDDLLSSHLGTQVMNFVDLWLEPWHGKTIAVVSCARREEPTLVDDRDFFVRRTASTVKLSMRDALVWQRERRG